MMTVFYLSSIEPSVHQVLFLFSSNYMLKGFTGKFWKHGGNQFWMNASVFWFMEWYKDGTKTPSVLAADYISSE